MWSIFAYFGVIVVSHRMWLRCVFALVWGFVGGFFLSNWPNQSQLFLNFNAHEFPDQDTVDRLDVRLPECGLVWTEDTSRRASEKLSFFFHPRWLKFLCGYFFFFLLPRAVRDFFSFSVRYMEESGLFAFPFKKAQVSHVHVVVLTAPWHTFPFRQSTAAQAEQRGETDPLRKSGCHRCFWSLLERRCHSIPTASDIPLCGSFAKKLWRKKMEMCRFFSLSLG